jgi:hypothetical protein
MAVRSPAGEPPSRVVVQEVSKMNPNEKLAQAIIELIENNDEVAWAVQSCACRSPNIVKVY